MTNIKNTKYISVVLVLLAVMAMPAAGQNPLALTQGTITGTLTASATSVTLPLNALSGAVAWQITGTFVGTVSFEATVDGTNWIAFAVSPPGTAGVRVITATSTGIWQGNVAGLTSVRARCSAYTSGSIVITGKRGGVGVPFGVAP